MTDQTTAARPTPRWKCGKEYLPFHRSASHVHPDYRDGWNACYEAGRTAGQADTSRLDSGCIVIHDRDEFGESHYVEHRGIDLRAAIDAAIIRAQKDAP